LQGQFGVAIWIGVIDDFGAIWGAIAGAKWEQFWAQLSHNYWCNSWGAYFMGATFGQEKVQFWAAILGAMR